MKNNILIVFSAVWILAACTPAVPVVQTTSPVAPASPATPSPVLSPSSALVPNATPARTPSVTLPASGSALLYPSPDSQWTAILNRKAGSLEVQNSLGERKTLLPAGSGVHQARWSPDSRRLLFWTGPVSASAEVDGLSLWSLEVETGEATQLAEAALLNPSYQSWSQDGSALVFTNGGYRSAQVNKWLSLYEVASGKVRSLLARSEFVPGAVAWSPAGDSIAFAAVRASQTGQQNADWMSWENPAIQARRIYLLNPQSGEYRRLNAVEAYQDAPRWSGDGEKLYYVQIDGDQATIMAADPGTGEAQPVPGCKSPLPSMAGYYGQVDWAALYSSCQAITGEEAGEGVTGQETVAGCSSVEHLSPDTPEAQQIVDEFIQNFKAQQTGEYMGMAVLQRVDRLGDWAVVQGSVSGEGKDIIAVRQTPQGYQIAERYIITAPLQSFDEPEKIIPKYFLEKLPEALQALFTCLDQTWLLGSVPETQPQATGQLAYISTEDFTTEGVTQIIALQADGSNQTAILSRPMLITGMVSSPDGERIAFTGCPGSLSSDCLAGEDLDVWTVSWDGSNLKNLTEAFNGTDSHPDWSPDGKQIIFDSDRSGNPQIYIMNSDGSNPRLLTSNPRLNTEPKWSPDGNWIAYHCSQAGETRICVVSPGGQPAGEPVKGTTPVWSPDVPDFGVRLAYLCFQNGHSDICTARPDGSGKMNLTRSPIDEHSPAWSPDGIWLAFVSNRGEDVDIYKVCANCPGENLVVRLTDEPRAAGWPVWSPDGSRVAYVAGQDLMVINADRTGATYLASGVFGSMIWRP